MAYDIDSLLLLSLEDVPAYCKRHLIIDVDINLLNALIKYNLLSIFRMNTVSYVFLNDLKTVIPILAYNRADDKLIDWQLFWKEVPLIIKLNNDTELININIGAQTDPTYYAALRNLFKKTYSMNDNNKTTKTNIPYFPPTKICTSSDSVCNYIFDQLSRYKVIQSFNTTQFASSAYYMGSKRLLRGFLVEAISSILPKNGVVLDLMCGSGAASGAFSKIWKTYASDAQQFCQKLAIIQGGGFSVKNAKRIIEYVLPIARDHVAELGSKVNHFLEVEENIFHNDLNEAAIKEYFDFLKSFPTYPDGNQKYGWDPVCEVEQRKINNQIRPYCLFTAYFANQYFGLRQSIEIDSLRFAIETIDDKKTQDWALGTLIATMSSAGTTHGGHFAQPKKITSDNIFEFLEKRSLSVTYEFCIRLLALAEESERSLHEIITLDGPWLNALSSFENLQDGKPIVVYLDAPYTREEYSRYYHVLETLINYYYHSCLGVGKIPNKRKRERFDSEFFTRIVSNFTKELVQVINEILSRGWICAWSYSDSGGVNIIDAVKKVRESIFCDIYTYSTPHQHKSQGGKKSKMVNEYIILFVP